MDNTFTCAQCGVTYEKAWTDEEAAAEGAEVFGQVIEDPAVVCTDCYKTMDSFIPMREWARGDRG